jgi:menaquinol-cytochrome c reductase iron-sulfur subunit
MNDLQNAEQVNRRTFIVKLLLIFSSLLAILLTIPVIGTILEPMFRKKKQIWRPITKIDTFKIGETKLVKFENASPEPWSGVTSYTSCWLRRVSETEFVAYAVYCTHLGCPVRWTEDAQLFLCPCHGGVYNKDGSNAAGPPPRPLDKYPARIRQGLVEIQTSPVPVTTTT